MVWEPRQPLHEAGRIANAVRPPRHTGWRMPSTGCAWSILKNVLPLQSFKLLISSGAKAIDAFPARYSHSRPRACRFHAPQSGHWLRLKGELAGRLDHEPIDRSAHGQ